MLVVVPLSMINDWHAKYETLTDMIVPRSTSMIFQDSDHALMTVSLFHKVVDEFKHKVYLYVLIDFSNHFILVVFKENENGSIATDFIFKLARMR